MTAAFPVAETAEAALHAPRGLAAREREAQAVAGAPVRFATEWVGPAFASREDAEGAYGERADPAFCTLRPVASEAGRPPPPATPTCRDGVRWAATPAAAPARWRLSVSFWRVLGAAEEAQALELEAARRLRRDAGAGGALDARALRRLAAQPLRPVRAQQPLDIGLFEVRLPERPEATIPDE